MSHGPRDVGRQCLGFDQGYVMGPDQLLFLTIDIKRRWSFFFCLLGKTRQRGVDAQVENQDAIPSSLV